MPSHLYKYGRVNDYAEALFATAQVYFESAGNLNDPFECRPWFEIDRSDSDRLMAGFKTLALRMDPRLSDEEATMQARATMEAVDDGVIESLRTAIIEDLNSKVGIYCLTQRRDSILMWSHYADGHRGYCLEFETDSEHFGRAQPVEYIEKYPTVSLFTTLPQDQINPIFLSKQVEWEYEAELRVVDWENGPGLYGYPPELLTGVIFGMNMLEPQERKIREWVLRRGSSVKFYRARRDEREFRLHIDEA